MYTSSMSCKCIKVFVGMYYTYVHQYFFPPLPGYLRTLYMYTYVYVYFSLYVQIQIHTIRYKGKSQRGRSRCSMIHMCVFVINEIGVYHIRMLRSIMYVYIYRWKSNMQVKQARQQQQLEEQVWVYIRLSICDCAKNHSYVCHGSFSCVQQQQLEEHVCVYVSICLSLWHDSSICVAWLVYTCDSNSSWRSRSMWNMYTCVCVLVSLSCRLPIQWFVCVCVWLSVYLSSWHVIYIWGGTYRVAKTHRTS